MNTLFTKTREVKSPKRANPTDAGIDFFVPLYSEEMVNDILSMSEIDKDQISTDGILINPQQFIIIPSGIKVIIPKGQALIAFNKSGIASKKNIIRGACVVDHGYEGEIFINLFNAGNKVQKIEFDSKIIQFIQLYVNTDMPKEISNDEYQTICDDHHTESNRGEGGFGSTGLHK